MHALYTAGPLGVSSHNLIADELRKLGDCLFLKWEQIYSLIIPYEKDRLTFKKPRIGGDKKRRRWQRRLLCFYWANHLSMYWIAVQIFW